LLIFHYSGIIERTQQIAARLKFSEQAFVVDVEPQRLCGRVQICAIYEQRYFFTGYRHWSLPTCRLPTVCAVSRMITFADMAPTLRATGFKLRKRVHGTSTCQVAPSREMWRLTCRP